MKNYYYLFVLSSFINDRVVGSGGRVQGEDAGYKTSMKSRARRRTRKINRKEGVKSQTIKNRVFTHNYKMRSLRQLSASSQ